MLDIDDEWTKFLNHNDDTPSVFNHYNEIQPNNVPECGKINISTKTKILYFNVELDLNDIFWKMPMISYDDYNEGIIKKQMKFNFTDKNDVLYFEEKIKNITQPLDVKILNKIDNPNGRVAFKDVRKVSIGISKNDMIKYNKKSKSAFYNCYVIIYRIYIEDEDSYREIHFKLFNSGKVEIPGIQNDNIIDISSEIIIKLLQPYYDFKVEELKQKRDTILVNSNFNCNYYLNREKLYRIMKQEYNIKCNFDSCSYPGIQCKYKLKNNQEVSFMIFRTGSILIVGKCENEDLYMIYEYIKTILDSHFKEIYESNYIEKPLKNKKKIKKNIYCVKT